MSQTLAIVMMILFLVVFTIVPLLVLNKASKDLETMRKRYNKELLDFLTDSEPKNDKDFPN